jgi:spore photoproduct lyase
MIDTIYIEEEIKENPKTLEILQKFKGARRISIDRYTETFNRKNQNFRLQKLKPNLILAKKHKGFVLPTPKGFGIGDQKNFYFSHMYNCLYDCSYCFLQGMYSSADYVIFVNFEDFKREIMETIEKNRDGSMTFFSGYDCDSVAMEAITSFINDFIPVFNNCKNASIEFRTKSVQTRVFEKLEPISNGIIAYSLMPEDLAKKLDKRAPSVRSRIEAMKKISDRGWKIGLRFDPLIYSEGWKEKYRELFEKIYSSIDDEKIHSISLGSLRFPKSFF